MNYLAVIGSGLACLLVAMRRGPGAALAYVYLPVLLLIGIVTPIKLEPLPDMDAQTAAALGAIVGTLLYAGRLPPLRFAWLDLFVLLCSVTVYITAFSSGTTWTLITFAGNDVLRYLAPYAMARVAFFDPGTRRSLAVVLSWLMIFLGVCALIEFRLRPLFLSRFLEDLNLSHVDNNMVLKRAMFFRAMVTTNHPIDLGNVGMIMAGLIPALAITGGLSVRSRLILFGIGGSLACVLASISFSSICGLGVAGALYVALRYYRRTELLLTPGLLAAIVVGFALTLHMLSLDLASLRSEIFSRSGTADGSLVDESYYVRVLIVQNAWNRLGKDAGLFGFGDQNAVAAEVGLKSIDNSYMLFLLRRGWSGLMTRLALGLCITVVGTRVLANRAGESGRAPAAALVGVLLGTMAAMYTVWFGFTFSVLWTIAVGFLASMQQVLQMREAAMPAAASLFGAPAAGGVAALPPGYARPMIPAR